MIAACPLCSKMQVVSSEAAVIVNAIERRQTQDTCPECKDIAAQLRARYGRGLYLGGGEGEATPPIADQPPLYAIRRLRRILGFDGWEVAE